MANIVGEPFEEWVSKQINDRQKLHGSQNRTLEQISYVNSRTPYLKLTSGVLVVDKERLTRIGLSRDRFMDIGLAENFILSGGVHSQDSVFNSDNKLNSGLQGIKPSEITGTEMDQSILNLTAYGLGGTEQGLKPMAGIISADTKFRNRGSIREGNIQIKAWNKGQFEVINLIYLRLGFPMLLEWGHSIIIGEDGKIDSNPNFSVSSDFLGKKFKTDNDVLKAISEKRKQSAGNYDAMYGKVVNFDWTFNKDGSYDITLKLISIGAVVESLKMNVYQKDVIQGLDKSKQTDNGDTEPENDEDWITKFQFSHTLGSIFWKAMKLLFAKNPVSNDTITYINSSELEPFINNFRYPTDNKNNKDYILYGSDTGFFGVNEFFLVRFGTLLKLLKNILPCNGIDPNNPSPIVDIIDLDDSSKIFSNFIYTTDYQVSGDPRKCLVGGFTYPSKTKNIPPYDKTSYFIGELATNMYKVPYKGYTYGMLKNVYVNMAFILQILQEKTDKDGNISFIDLMQAVLDGVNSSLGNINKIECVVDEDSNTVKFVEGTPMPGFDDITGITDKFDQAATLQVYGYNDSFTSAGFVRDFSLKTEITNDLAAMMTIGATANKNVVGEDATAFSKWNKGLLPIVGENIIAGFSDPKNKSQYSAAREVAEKMVKLETDNEQLVQDYSRYVSKANMFMLAEDDVDSGSQLVANILAYQTEMDNLFKQWNNLASPQNNTSTSGVSATSSRGFLPINLSVTVDGLSGVVIYQQIKVDTTYLPSDYPDTLKFIIKGVSHKINKGGWLTTLDTVSIPVIDKLVLTPPNSVTNTNAAGASQSPNTKQSYKSNGPVTYMSNDCSQDATIRVSTNYNLAQLSCQAPAAKYSVPKEGETKYVGPLVLTRQNIINNLKGVAENIIEPIRKKFPSVIATNAYRNKGGTSQHEKGEAVDLQFGDISGTIENQNTLMVKRAEEIKTLLGGVKGFDQFLLEYTTTGSKRPWIHISYKSSGTNRNEIRTFLNKVTAPQGNGKFFNPVK